MNASPRDIGRSHVREGLARPVLCGGFTNLEKGVQRVAEVRFLRFEGEFDSSGMRTVVVEGCIWRTPQGTRRGWR
jgi:hypothetical protein